MFGAETLKRSSEVNPYEVISTGSLTLDYRLSVGGYVEGRLVEIWGPDGVGKTTLSIMGMREAQKKHPDKMVAFIDMEQKFDKAWAATHGVDLGRLYLYTPETAEDVADAMKELCSSGLVSMVVLDSVGAMLPKMERVVLPTPSAPHISTSRPSTYPPTDSRWNTAPVADTV